MQAREQLPNPKQIENALAEKSFHGDPVKVMIDDRDMRGGEKKWFHVKRGVPIRLEVGPRDIADHKVFMSRRDTGENQSIDKNEFIAEAVNILANIQNNLYERALKLQKENTVRIDSLDEFKAYFTAKDSNKPEIHGGFAMSHWCEDPAVYKVLEELKVTIRCVPFDEPEENGVCIFTGKPSTKRAVFGKAY